MHLHVHVSLCKCFEIPVRWVGQELSQGKLSIAVHVKLVHAEQSGATLSKAKKIEARRKAKERQAKKYRQT